MFTLDFALVFLFILVFTYDLEITFNIILDLELLISGLFALMVEIFYHLTSILYGNFYMYTFI